MASKLYGLIPAAGTGERFSGMPGSLPKQYQRLDSASGVRTMLEHSVRALLALPDIDVVFVVLAAGDAHFRAIDWSDVKARVEPLYCGGASRRDSVLNGLVAMEDSVDPDDWVLVHDGARPCLGAVSLRRLVDEVAGDAEGPGGILAVPVADTLKHADNQGCIAATAPRDGLWQAQTPQMFRHGLLTRAMAAALQVTDEAGAVEQLGLRPRLVRGSSRNLKVTLREDLTLAELILRQADQ